MIYVHTCSIAVREWQGHSLTASLPTKAVTSKPRSKEQDLAEFWAELTIEAQSEMLAELAGAGEEDQDDLLAHILGESDLDEMLDAVQTVGGTP